MVWCFEGPEQTKEAHLVSQQALTKTPDHCTIYHELWLALDEALQGDYELGQQCTPKIKGVVYS